jgi:hypothetical protein
MRRSSVRSHNNHVITEDQSRRPQRHDVEEEVSQMRKEHIVGEKGVHHRQDLPKAPSLEQRES